VPLCASGGRHLAGQAAASAGLPPVVLAAAVLAADGVSLLLAGSAALWLRGEPVTVGDADVVIEPGADNMCRLHAALAGMALRPRDVPPPRRLATLPVVTIATSYGRVDCLLERGRRDWEQLRRGASPLAVADVSVLAASVADAQALRRRFKGSCR
jgi:hypothetical protein